jgi:hypothetical protein
MASTDSLAALAALIRDGENVISPYVREPDEHPALGALAAAGPRAVDARAEYVLLVEAIREGYLLHYGTPRLLQGADADLWLSATAAVGAGGTPAHERAKEALRRGDPDAGRLLAGSAADLARQAGIAEALDRAADSIGFSRENLPNRG